VKKVTRCNDCRDTDGWILDPETFLPVKRCGCAEIVQTARQARDAALSTVGWSKPQQMRAAYRIIEEAAETQQYVSANTVRERMELAQIDGPVRGAAFRKAVDEGLLEAEGEVTSSDVGTHGKRVQQYRSRSFARQLGVS
jgi:hypothetical protein